MAESGHILVTIVYLQYNVIVMYYQFINLFLFFFLRFCQHKIKHSNPIQSYQESNNLTLSIFLSNENI